MYNPIQVPYLINPSYKKYFKYTTEKIPTLQDFVICVWEHQPLTQEIHEVRETIIPDGCIDIGMNFKERFIGYSGLSKPQFDFINRTDDPYLSATLKPGAFEQLTGRHATDAMDSFCSLTEFEIPFDAEYFFALPYEKQKTTFIGYLHRLVEGHKPNQFVQMIDRFSKSPPSSVVELCEVLGVTTRQCQRLFLRHYGLTPKMMLSTLRFQYCLQILMGSAGKSDQDDLMLHYYDQSHYIKDFKKYIGFTPLEYLEICRKEAS